MNQPLMADTPATSTERVSDLVQKLVAAATAEVEAAAQRTRAQAQVEITQLQRTIDRLRAELQEERDKLKVAVADLTLARAEASNLEDELEAERAEKARFAATLETVRLVIAGIDPELHSPDPTSSSTGHVAEVDDDLTVELDADPDVAEYEPDSDSGTSQSVGPPETGTTSRFDASRHLAQLLAQIEEIYRSDLKSAVGTSEVVARLAANLEYARDAHTRRLESADAADAALFDRQVAALLDARADTPFGRHLAMAIGRRVPVQTAVNELRKEAS